MGVTRTVLTFALRIVLVGLAVAACPRDARAIGGGVGIDYSGGPGDQRTQDALGYLTTKLGGEGDLTLIGARYDNTEIGPGTLGAVGVGIPVPGLTLIRVSGARTIGDQDYRAFRLQAGPELNVGGGRTLGIFYLHVEDNLASLSNGVVTELGVPISPVLAGGLGAAVASKEGGRTSAQGTASMTWGPASRVQLLGEMSVGQNVVGFSQSGSSSQGGVLGRLPIVGNGSSKKEAGAVKAEYGTQATGLVGIRFLFP
jgi:hypothetical protein